MIDLALPISESLTEWDEFLLSRRPDIGFKQSPWWSEFLQIRGWSNLTIALKDADEIVGGANVLRKAINRDTCYYYIPHGPVLPDDPRDAQEIFEGLLAHLDAARQDDPLTVSHLRIEPHWAETPSYLKGFREARGWIDPRLTLCVDLNLSDEEILAQMKQKGRYNIRLAKRKGVTVVEDNTPQGVEDFLSIYRETFDRHELYGHSRQYLRALIDRLAPLDRGTLLFAEHEGQRIATVLLIYFGETATYKYGGSLMSHRSLMAPYLLHYDAMRFSRAHGCRWYDFYGVSPVDEPDDQWANFSAFKRKFGGFERSFILGMDLVYSEPAYEAYLNR